MGNIRNAVAAIAIMVGCGHSPSTPPPASPATPPAPCTSPEPLHISLKADARLNPSERGEPLATVVRIYQLKGTGRITVASFDDLMDHDRDTLGEDFVAVQEVTMNPGTKLDPPLFRAADATYVAVVGLFRRPSSTTWRAIEKLPPADPQFCHPAPPPDPKKANKPAAAPKDPTLRFSLEENRLKTIKTP
ncbi:MAG TPA: type VI secretion system lipoprotein TssJ [Polyangia bacterium]|nr:type VI secretion system lipoprotein TssJ [Polyangia bacterium]